jgi:ankyrin repeat protein
MKARFYLKGENLLEKLSSKDKEGRTPLINATIENQYDTVKVLIEKRANVNEQDNNGYSALHFASQNYYINIAKLLIESNADVNIKDLHGNTPLFRAVFNSMGRGEMISLLLTNGADKNSCNKHGISPLKLADTIGNYNVINFFELKSNIKG